MRRWGSLLAFALGTVALFGGATGPTAAAPRDDVRILASAAESLDPAAQGDISSAAVTAQMYESLTAFDASLVLQPALAASWTTSDAGKRIEFTLRPGLTFSDGTPLTATDVVRSWMRVIDPTAPSPLASLLDDVVGAAAYRRGELADPNAVGISAQGDQQVVVRLERPVGDFDAIVAGATFGVVPPGFTSAADATRLPVSGGYILSTAGSSELRLTANDRYWAGRPAIGSVVLVTDIAGRSAVDAYTAGDVDYAPISSSDAAWIAYDTGLGPNLREVGSLLVSYFGFDASRPPFDDARVRRAFALAVRWHRIAELGASGEPAPATSMVPPGIPGRSDRDFVPTYDPGLAQRLLAEAGYPSGTGFPAVTMMTSGTGHEEAIAAELAEVLGVHVGVETMDFSPYFDRLETDPPAIWSLSWVADYPGPNDFLGLLLGSGRTNNYGRWSSPEFDAAISDALSAPDAATAREAYDRAEGIVRDEAPVIPLEYGSGWALARTGLLGAGQNGLGIIRMAGLAWAD